MSNAPTELNLLMADVVKRYCLDFPVGKRYTFNHAILGYEFDKVEVTRTATTLFEVKFLATTPKRGTTQLDLVTLYSGEISSLDMEKE